MITIMMKKLMSMRKLLNFLFIFFGISFFINYSSANQSSIDSSLFEKDDDLYKSFRSNLDRELNTRAHWLLSPGRDYYLLAISNKDEKFFGWADYYDKESQGYAYKISKTHQEIEENKCKFNTNLQNSNNVFPIHAWGIFKLDCQNISTSKSGRWYQSGKKGIFVSDDKSLFGIFVDRYFFEEHKFDLLGTFLLPKHTFNTNINLFDDGLRIGIKTKSYKIDSMVDSFLNLTVVSSSQYFKELESLAKNKTNFNTKIKDSFISNNQNTLSNKENYIMTDLKLYVDVDTLNIRDVISGNIIDTALKNERLAIIENKNNWSKIITKDGLEGWVASQYLSPIINNKDEYVFCWDYSVVLNFNNLTPRKEECLANETKIQKDLICRNKKTLNVKKLLEACTNFHQTTEIVNIDSKKKDPELISEKKIIEVELSSNQITDITAPKISCDKVGTIKTSLINIKCKISDENELFAVVLNGKQLVGNLESLNEQIQVPFGNSKIEVIAYDSFGNQENLILDVYREFSLNNSQEEIEQLFPGRIKDKSSNNKVAVIIGIQNYADIPDTKYSDKDAMAFAEFANQTLNIPSKNIKYLFNEDAKYFGFKGIQTWLENKVNKNTDVYVFYSGHGLGVEGKSKLLPSDFVTQFQNESSYEKDQFLADISNLNPKHIYAFFDTCFSGLGRSGETLIAGLKNISIVEEVLPSNNITIFNSSSGLEFSTDFDAAGHGLFSYYLMKGLEGNADFDGDRKLTTNELFSFIKENVSEKALDIGLNQNPSLINQEDRTILQW